jgi:hypothetical protein
VSNTRTGSPGLSWLRLAALRGRLSAPQRQTLSAWAMLRYSVAGTPTVYVPPASPAPPGRSLFVTVEPDGGAALYEISVRGPEWAPDPNSATLEFDTRLALDQVRRVVSDLPFAWTPLPEGHLAVVRVDEWTHWHQGPARVDGRSLSLAAALALVSERYKVGLPGSDLAAADIHPDTGELVAVLGVAEKVAGLAHMATGLKRLWVAAGAEEAWKQALIRHGMAVEVCARTHVWDVVKELFDPPALLRNLDSGELDRLESHLFRLVSQHGMNLRIRWSGVAEALAHARVVSQGRRVLAVIARRWSWSTPDFAPDADMTAWVLQLPRQRREELIAQLIQGYGDSGLPIPAELLPCVPIECAGWNDHKIRGAYARALLATETAPPNCAATQHPPAQQALVIHRELISFLWSVDRPDQISYSLADLLRLAGGLEDSGCFAWGLAQLDQLRALADTDPADIAYCALAAARGALWFRFSADPPTDGHGAKELSENDRLVEKGRAELDWLERHQAHLPPHLHRPKIGPVPRTRALWEGARLEPGPHGIDPVSLLWNQHEGHTQGGTVDVAMKLPNIRGRFFANLAGEGPEPVRRERILRFYPY